MDVPKKDHEHNCNCCSGPVTNPSVQQSLDEIDFERSVWQAAIDNNVEKIIKFCSSVDFTPNQVDKYGYTALHYAARNGSLDAAKCLIKHGANVNAQTGSLQATPLHRAVTARKPEMVQYLLESGANTGIKDVDGLTAVDRAKKDKDSRIMKLFLPILESLSS